MVKLFGPFKQLITMRGLPLKGSLRDEDLEIITEAGILIEGNCILQIGKFEAIRKNEKSSEIHEIEFPAVGLPAFVDAHTHICFAGSRSMDFALRNAGKTYLEIAAEDGGIWSTVQHSRSASDVELIERMNERLVSLAQIGITTIEIKSGYGLNPEHELRMLRCIQQVKQTSKLRIVPTCLAAHTLPKDFEGSHQEYLEMCLREILPKVKEEGLSQRVDIFTEKSAFGIEESKNYLLKAKKMGFDLTVHADQFSSGSAKMAVEVGAKSADHLEVITDEYIKFLASSETVATALPGASLGLGEPFAPARKLLNAGACVAIASDWNPGSAPMGNLVTQASILAAYEKLSTAEVFAGITFRAAHALGLKQLGRLEKSFKADFQAFATDDFREILYHQGRLQPKQVFSEGRLIQ